MMQRRRFIQVCATGACALTAERNRLSADLRKKIEIKGAYGSPKSFWNQGARLDAYGINALFVGSGSIDDDLLRRARSEGARVFAEFPALNGSEWLTRRVGDQEEAIESHADAWPIDSEGNRSPRQTWFLGVCPTNEAFVQSRLDALRELVTSRRLDGVWLDYIHWHAQFEDPVPRLPETCFNESCVRRFSEATRIKVNGTNPREWSRDILKNHEAQWRSWRCGVLASFARRCREVIWQHAPRLLFGSYQCGWRDDEYRGARRNILGLDLGLLAGVFDVMSPMLYHGRSGHSPAWVQRNVKWLSHRLKLRGLPNERMKIWPIVQAWTDPDGRAVDAREFEQVLRGGMSAGASGVMMFTLDSVAQDEEKLAVLKTVYRET